MKVNNIEFLEEDAEFFPDGSIHDATLAQDTVIHGIPCAGDRNVVFYPSGKLKLCWLSSTTILNNIPCKDDVIYLYENSQLWNVSLASDYQINIFLHLSGSRLTFDKTGELLEYSHSIDEDQLIEEFPCSSQFIVWRYANGRPSVIVLSSNHTISNQEYPRGAEILLNEDGEVIDWHVFDLDSGQYRQRLYGVFEVNWL